MVESIDNASRTKFTKHRLCEVRVANSHIPLGAQRFADNGICLSGSRTALDIINVNFVRDALKILRNKRI